MREPLETLKTPLIYDKPMSDDDDAVIPSPITGANLKPSPENPVANCILPSGASQCVPMMKSSDNHTHHPGALLLRFTVIHAA